MKGKPKGIDPDYDSKQIQLKREKAEVSSVTNMRIQNEGHD
jgi:hypothetical protein